MSAAVQALKPGHLPTSSAWSRSLKGLLVGVVIGLGGAVLGLSPLGSDFETGVGLPWLFNIRGAIVPPKEVVVVAIDGRTGGQLGLPSAPREWPRSIHARLVDALIQRGASVVVFDVLFEKPKSPEDDRAFAEAVARANRVVLVEKLTGKREPVADAEGVYRGTVWIEELVPPMPSLAESARGLAPFPLPKLEAAVSEFWVFKDSVGGVPMMPAMAFQIHALGAYPEWLRLLRRSDAPGVRELPSEAGELTGAQRVRDLSRATRRLFDQSPGLGEALAGLVERDEALAHAPETRGLLKALTRLYDSDPHRYLNFYGPAGTIATIPYAAVIKGRDPNLQEGALDFTGKVAFVGYSDLYDPGQPDRFYTVFTRSDGVDLSGVEIAATAFGNLLTDRTLKPLGTLAAALALVSFGTLMGAIVYLLPAVAGVPLSLALAALYALAAQWSFSAQEIWLPLATPLLAQFPAALFLGLFAQYRLERRRRKHISGAINYYLPEHIARELTENRLDPSAANSVVYGTCLATDMAGFSTIAEKLGPGELASFLNEYFDALAQPLKRHHVDVTEFRADAIMCAWTAPAPEPATRNKAVLAALGAAEAIGRFKERHQLLGNRLRIGLESGWVYVGHAGGGGHFVYSIVGDCANTASRVEGLNKHLGTQLLATGSVIEGLDDLLLRPLGSFVFVGKSEALPIVEILSLRSTASEAQVRLCGRFGEVLAEFHEARWEPAAEGFERILAQYPDDGPAGFYLSLCQRYRDGASPPDDPRIIRMESK